MSTEAPTSITSQWPPPSSARRRRNTVTTPNSATPLTPTSPGTPPSPTPEGCTDRTAIQAQPVRQRSQTYSQGTTPSTKQWRNGYEVKNKAPSYTPYSLRSGRTFEYRKAFAFEAAVPIQPHEPLGIEDWVDLARTASIIQPGWSLRDFQVSGSNIIIRRKKDLVVIVPTGHGKSLLWLLPLLVQNDSISLVITPFTSLGSEGEMKYVSLLMFRQLRDTD